MAPDPPAAGAAPARAASATFELTPAEARALSRHALAGMLPGGRATLAVLVLIAAALAVQSLLGWRATGRFPMTAVIAVAYLLMLAVMPWWTGARVRKQSGAMSAAIDGDALVWRTALGEMRLAGPRLGLVRRSGGLVLMGLKGADGRRLRGGLLAVPERALGDVEGFVRGLEGLRAPPAA